MTTDWEKRISCATHCSRCEKKIGPKDQRILSVYDHEPVCMACKKAEENREDYQESSKNMIGQCMAETEVLYSDPGGFCFYHFYPFTCD